MNSVVYRTIVAAFGCASVRKRKIIGVHCGLALQALLPEFFHNDKIFHRFRPIADMIEQIPPTGIKVKRVFVTQISYLIPKRYHVNNRRMTEWRP